MIQISNHNDYFLKTGKSQAILTGKRLKELNLPYTKLVHSTMCRAIETAKLIHAFIPDVPTKDCKLLEEGAPIIPEPPVGHVKSPHHVCISLFYFYYY